MLRAAVATDAPFASALYGGACRHRGGLPHARYYTERTGNGSEYGNEEFQNFFPVDFHGMIFIYEL